MIYRVKHVKYFKAELRLPIVDFYIKQRECSDCKKKDDTAHRDKK